MTATPTLPTLDIFKADAIARGFNEVLVREWPAGQVVPAHQHDFSVEALVVQGEMWLECGGANRRLLPGDTFTLARNEPHAEIYGAEGATYWAARKTAT